MEPTRYHAFDSLRGAMMLLGVVLHSATMYSTIDGVWWLKDPSTGRWADTLIGFLHAFRLPAFFVMAGFFACLLKEKRGWQAMLENRMARLGLPFLVAMITIFPFLKMISVYGYFAGRGLGPWAATLDWLGRGRFNATLEPGHMWFLETLMWTILVALAVSRWLDRLEGGWFLRVMTAWWGWAVMALVSYPTLLLTEVGLLDTPKGFTPNWHVVGAYLVFFAFGWGLYRNRAAIGAMRRGGWPEMLFALALLPPTIMGLIAQMENRDTRLWGPYLAVAALTAITAWLMIYGLLGLFLRKYSEASPLSRYLSDSAYWVYLAHPVALIVIQFPMMALPVHGSVKFVLGVAFAVPLLYWSYDRLVRPTWIGVLLNGRRSEPMLAGLLRPQAPNARTGLVTMSNSRNPGATSGRNCS
jgi:glucans biosynthesis protein C